MFRITRQGRLQVLHTFAGGSDGAYPTGSLVKDSTGAIYGATQTGSVFRLGN